jgi:hypothetical protein
MQTVAILVLWREDTECQQIRSQRKQLGLLTMTIADILYVLRGAGIALLAHLRPDPRTDM